MGTTPIEEPAARGVIRRVGDKVAVITDEVVTTAYGSKRGSIYALSLLLIVGCALVLAGSSSPTVADLVGLIALVLLAVWIGAKH
jgi:hypothetical protein